MTHKLNNYKNIKDTFVALLKDANLITGDDLLSKGDITSMSRVYESNYAFLNCSHQARDAIAEALARAYPKISKKTLGTLAWRQVVKLFEQIAISEDADPNLWINQLRC